jgi:hypothetical protein
MEIESFSETLCVFVRKGDVSPPTNTALAALELAYVKFKESESIASNILNGDSTN